MNPEIREGLTTLGQAQPEGLLQVLVSSFRVERSISGLVLHLEIHDDLPVITTTAERKRVQERLDFDEGREVLRAIAELSHLAPKNYIDFDLKRFAFRHASAGVLPLLGPTLSPLLFLRDIHPIGWNIANGGSADRAELLKIEDLMLREAQEELLFHDRKRGLLRSLEGAEELTETKLALRLWRTRLSCGIGTALRYRFRLGPDTMVVSEGFLTRKTRGLKLGFDVLGFGFEAIRFLEIDDQAELRPLDGEIYKGRLLDRRIGLFHDLSELRRSSPREIFQGGRRLAQTTSELAPLCPATAAICLA